MESLIGRLKPFRNKKTNANTAHTILYIEYFKRIVFGAHVSLEYVFVYYLYRVLFKRPLSPFPFICPHAFFPYKVFSFSKLYKKLFFCFCSHTILYTYKYKYSKIYEKLPTLTYTAWHIRISVYVRGKKVIFLYFAYEVCFSCVIS